MKYKVGDLIILDSLVGIGVITKLVDNLYYIHWMDDGIEYFYYERDIKRWLKKENGQHISI